MQGDPHRDAVTGCPDHVREAKRRGPQTGVAVRDKQLSIRFWGTRGNAAPLAPSLEFGNHTTCAEIRAEGMPALLIDLGTGAIGAGARLLDEAVREFDVFLTHLHIDHLQGLFSFAPFYCAGCRVRLRAARLDVKPALTTLLAAPFHPVPLDRLAAKLDFIQMPEQGSAPFPKSGVTVSWAPLAHPQGCTGYRFDDGTNAIVFATDVELGALVSHAPLEGLLQEPYPAGLAVLDGFFTDDEIDQYADWGHSSWGQARDLGRRTGIRTVMVTHHHPNQTDEKLRAHETEGRPLRWARDDEAVILARNRVVAQSG